MLKKLGYFSYLLGIEGIVFVIYIMNTVSNLSDLKSFLILAGIVFLSISQWLFLTYTLKTLQNRTYKKTGTIDEYLSMGMEDNQSLLQLPLVWRIIGWVVLISSIGVAIISMGLFSEYAFSRWKRFDIYAILTFVSFIIAISSIIYTLRVVNRKWIGEKKEKEEL